MAFWSGEKILENRDLVSDFSEDRVDTNAYNLRMGGSYFRTADQEAKEPQKKEILKEGEPFIIPAGQFAFLLSKETVHIPANAMAFISMRTAVKFKGLINVSGFHVEPGYHGRLVYGVFNASPMPIQICEGDELFKMWFAGLDRMSERLFDKAPINDITNEMIHGMSREIYSLQAMSEKMRALEQSVETQLATQRPTIASLEIVWRSITIGVVVAVTLSVLILAWPSLISTAYAIRDHFFP